MKIESSIHHARFQYPNTPWDCQSGLPRNGQGWLNRGQWHRWHTSCPSSVWIASPVSHLSPYASRNESFASNVGQTERGRERISRREVHELVALNHREPIFYPSTHTLEVRGQNTSRCEERVTDPQFYISLQSFPIHQDHPVWVSHRLPYPTYGPPLGTRSAIGRIVGWVVELQDTQMVG